MLGWPESDDDLYVLLNEVMMAELKRLKAARRASGRSEPVIGNNENGDVSF